MKNIYIETIAPLLRGLTFDGEKGNISIFEDDSKKVGFAIDKIRSEETLPLYLKGVKNQNLLNKEQLVEKIISYTIDKFKDYIKKYKQKPKIVILENIGIFYLGESYDNAINIKNNFLKWSRFRSTSSWGLQLKLNWLHNFLQIFKVDCPVKEA